MSAGTTLTPVRGRLDAGGYLIALAGIVRRELLRFFNQKERFFSALVRPLVWLFIFAAGFRAVLGLSITPPYQTYVLYEVYVTPGDVERIARHTGADGFYEYRAPDNPVYLEQDDDDFLETITHTGRTSQPKTAISRSAVVRLALERLHAQMSPEQIVDELRPRGDTPGTGRKRR